MGSQTSKQFLIYLIPCLPLFLFTLLPVLPLRPMCHFLKQQGQKVLVEVLPFSAHSKLTYGVAYVQHFSIPSKCYILLQHTHSPNTRINKSTDLKISQSEISILDDHPIVNTHKSAQLTGKCVLSVCRLLLCQKYRCKI